VTKIYDLRFTAFAERRAKNTGFGAAPNFAARKISRTPQSGNGAGRQTPPIGDFGVKVLKNSAKLAFFGANNLCTR